MSTPEANFKRRVLTAVKGIIHAEAGYSPYSTGKPDHFYEGQRADLYVEYKWHLLKRVTSNLHPKLDLDLYELCSGTQRGWINRRRANGHTAWVAVGVNTRFVAVHFTGQIDEDTRECQLFTFDQYIQILVAHTGRSHDLVSADPAARGARRSVRVDSPAPRDTRARPAADRAKLGVKRSRVSRRAST